MEPRDRSRWHRAAGVRSRSRRNPPAYYAFSAVIVAAILATAEANADAKRLYHDLINGYSSLIRPVGNNSDRLTVKMGLKLSQLIDVVSLLRTGSPSFSHCSGLIGVGHDLRPHSFDRDDEFERVYAAHE